jgi:hypothetical protein
VADLRPPKESNTEEEAIRALAQMAEDQDSAAAAANGACIYIAGSKTYCNNLTKKQCDSLKGAWYAGEKCP